MLFATSARMCGFSLLLLSSLLVGCGGGSGGNGSASPSTPTFSVTTDVGIGGTVSLSAASAQENQTIQASIAADTGFTLASVTGCAGSLDGDLYTTGPLTEDCTIAITFNAPTQFSELSMTVQPVKSFAFSWQETDSATHYRVLENADGASGFTQIGADIVSGLAAFEWIVPLYDRLNAQYILQTCYDTFCLDSQPIGVDDNLQTGVGFFKASNADANDNFGYSVALSADGTTMAVGAPYERSLAKGIDGDQADNTAVFNAGAVYVFVRSGSQWQQQAYIKASNTEESDFFGFALSLSGDGGTLAVGAIEEDGDSNQVDGDQLDNNASNAGAVYIFARQTETWSQEAYIKASNSGLNHYFGWEVDLSSDGLMLAVSAPGEDGGSTGVNGDQALSGGSDTGAAYIFEKSEDSWLQTHYIKASNSSGGDNFGWSLDLSDNGQALAVGAWGEDSSATGVNGDQDDDSLGQSGAAYVFVQNNSTWEQQAYFKGNETDEFDWFGASVALSKNGLRMAVSAIAEDSSSTGINGDATDNSSRSTGAVYVFDYNGSQWSQTAYIKDSDPQDFDDFGFAISLSADGNFLAISAQQDTAEGTGKASVFKWASGAWSLLDEIRGLSADPGDDFGFSLRISSDGGTLAIGDIRDSSSATGTGGDTQDNSLDDAGGVFVY